MSSRVLVKKYEEGARLPKKAHVLDSGFDLACRETTWIMPFSSKWVGLGFGIQLPPGVSMTIRPRSSFSVAEGWLVHVGTIDTGYIGEVKVAVLNLRPWPRRIKARRRIAQAILQRPELQYEFVWTPHELLSADDRGYGGFGSTGGEYD